MLTSVPCLNRYCGLRRTSESPVARMIAHAYCEIGSMSMNEYSS
jgi:hypothetical protein